MPRTFPRLRTTNLAFLSLTGAEHVPHKAVIGFAAQIDGQGAPPSQLRSDEDAGETREVPITASEVLESDRRAYAAKLGDE